MTGPERDNEFEAYLKRRARIDRRLRSLDRLEPPAELDRIIIARARQSIQGAPPVPLFRAPRWALPMGMAATILISLSVLLDLGVRDAVRRDARRPEMMAAAVARQSEPAAAATLAATAAPAAIATAPWPPLPARTAADEAANSSAEGDSAARSRVSEHFLATNRLRTADASGSAEAEPMQATWQAGARMAVVTVIGTRIHQ
jgi:hypothetical protein